MLHMAENGQPMTSTDLAQCLHTNPVVVRRLMAGLRNAGFVVSGRGHGGGWVLAQPLANISLLDVHLAVGEPLPGVDLPPKEPAGAFPCLIEQAVQRALDASLRAAADLLMQRLAQVTLADLAADFRQAMQRHAALHGAGIASSQSRSIHSVESTRT